MDFLYSLCFWFNFILYQKVAAAKAAERVAGDISRRKKVKGKQPSPFLFSGESSV